MRRERRGAGVAVVCATVAALCAGCAAGSDVTIGAAKAQREVRAALTEFTAGLGVAGEVRPVRRTSGCRDGGVRAGVSLQRRGSDVRGGAMGREIERELAERGYRVARGERAGWRIYSATRDGADLLVVNVRDGELIVRAESACLTEG